jgi:prevent-host-death family protein
LLAMMYKLMYITFMSKRYSIAEARAHFPEIVHEAEGGQEIELTRRGKPVAVVVSLQELKRLRGDRPRFVDVYRNFIRKYSVEEAGLDDDFLEVIRDKAGGREVSL